MRALLAHENGPDMSDFPRISVLDMHTGGEPVRIIRSGFPLPKGGSILDKRRQVQAEQDHLRRLLMFEPRGHYDMYGALLVEPSLPGADLAVLFLHNEGYSTMCGHAVIALGRYAVDYGLVPVTEPLTQVNIECPCGLVTAWVEVQNGQSGRVSFDSVPAFLFQSPLQVEVPGYGMIHCDVSYGGAFYALTEARQFGLNLQTARVRDIVDAATALSDRVKAICPPQHPEHPDLSFLYGSILTDSQAPAPERASRNVCVFADAEVDRSPTGSGVTARMAAWYQQGKVGLNQSARFQSITGACFDAEVRGETRCGDRTAVTVRVSGRAYYSGEATFWLEDGDDIGRGFLLR